MGEKFGVAIQPVDCFTCNIKDFREILTAADGSQPLAA